MNNAYFSDDKEANKGTIKLAYAQQDDQIVSQLIDKLEE